MKPVHVRTCWGPEGYHSDTNADAVEIGGKIARPALVIQQAEDGTLIVTWEPVARLVVRGPGGQQRFSIEPDEEQPG